MLPPTVDGRNPANQLRLRISHYLPGFSTIPGGDSRISEPSTVLPEPKNKPMISGLVSWAFCVVFDPGAAALVVGTLGDLSSAEVK